MFCPKCGAKAPDDAVFCQQCGAKLNPSDTAQPTADSPTIPTKQASGASGKAPKKKKKLPIIIGAAVLLVAIIVAAICLISGGGGRDNVATVQAHKPFATSQNLPYTFAEVFDKYTNNPAWYTDSEDEKTNTATVKVDGIVKGTDYRLIVSIEVSPNPDDPDGCFIRPQSVNFDGIESSNQNETVEFLYHMFAAYDKGYEDLSELLASPEVSVNTELSQVYTNEDMGISFQYPSDWELFEFGDVVSITHNTAGHTVVFEVVNTLQSNPFGIFTDDAASIEAAVNQSSDMIVQSIEDTTISGIPVRVLNYRTGGLNGTEPVVMRSCYYINGDDAYRITCSCSESTADAYQELFDAILDSYTIIPIKAITPSQGTDETEPPQDNQTPTATTGFIGLWQDASGACQMEISNTDGDGIYTIEATQDLGSGEWREWYLEGDYEQNFGVFCWGYYLELGLREDGTVSGGANYMESNDVIYFGDDGLLHWFCDAVGFEIILTRK